MIRTAEFVSRAHPDKVCDQIADYLLDRFLEQDPMSRVAIEVMGSHGMITVCGEVTTKGWVDVPEAVKFVLRDVGYLKNGEHYGIVSNIVAQSPEISRGVDTGGAGDQGIMYGYATKKTVSRLPEEYAWAREFLAPYQDRDAKCQVTMEDDILRTLVMSVSGTNNLEIESKLDWINPAARLIVNPAGNWDLCGFDADTGLTGRKLGVDTYGGLAAHGGGAFSGKDPSKVDRSAAYMARYVAKWMLDKYDLSEVQIGLAYAIGVAEPVMIEVMANGIDSSIGKQTVESYFDFRPEAIIERFDLRRPIYYKTAQQGHFTDPTFPWENV